MSTCVYVRVFVCVCAYVCVKERNDSPDDAGVTYVMGTRMCVRVCMCVLGGPDG